MAYDRQWREQAMIVAAVIHAGGLATKEYMIGEDNFYWCFGPHRWEYKPCGATTERFDFVCAPKSWVMENCKKVHG